MCIGVRSKLALLVGLLLIGPARAMPARAVEPDGPERVDVVVYGATPAGIAAALAAAGDGHEVLLVEPTARIGGLATSGLSHTDFRTFEGLTGFYLDFTRRVEAGYVDGYGPDSPQVRDCWRGTQAEPHVNLWALERMLAESPRVRLVTRHRLNLVVVPARDPAGPARRIEQVGFHTTGGPALEVAPGCVIDASYEGDLMAAAGVTFRVGREGRSEYGESLAPEAADGQVQGYNFRLILTRDPGRRVAVPRPPGYAREAFVPVLELLGTKALPRVFGYPTGCLFKAQLPPLPNGLYDINDVSGGPVRLSLPGANGAWPTGDANTRHRLFEEHLRHDVGLLYFLQNDPAVPATFRDEARQWGLCRDEFPETGHLPPQLYVREARRMVGTYVFHEHDTDAAPGDARSVRHGDAIAAGDYGPNCHGTAHEGPRIGGRHTGEFYKAVAPYQVPYGTIVPRDLANLLVPVACSATHVGFCALRLEPVWASLGQAAGHAASLAVEGKIAVQAVPVAALQARLHADGVATIYVSDVRPGHPDFALVQWWGTHGGLHGLAAAFDTPGRRGRNIQGQYYEAYPGHAVELDRVLDPDLEARWRTLAGALGVPLDGLPRADGTLTRGGWLRRVGLPRKP